MMARSGCDPITHKVGPGHGSSTLVILRAFSPVSDPLASAGFAGFVSVVVGETRGYRVGGSESATPPVATYRATRSCRIERCFVASVVPPPGARKKKISTYGLRPP